MQKMRLRMQNLHYWCPVYTTPAVAATTNKRNNASYILLFATATTTTYLQSYRPFFVFVINALLQFVHRMR